MHLKVLDPPQVFRGASAVAARRALCCSAILLLVGAGHRPAAGQLSTVVGRVVDESQGTPVSLAEVELEGRGALLTSEDGSFRFENVTPGGYDLRVVAYGYAPSTELLWVGEGVVTVEIRLEAAPVPLDPVIATLRPIDLRGSVRDPVNDYFITNAEVMTNQGQAAETNAHGRFRLRRVLEDVPLRVTVRAFGYVPLDTTLAPARGAFHTLELQPDEVVEAMVAAHVRVLEERHAPHFAPMFRSMNRDELLRYAGRHTLGTVLEFNHWRYVDRIVAVVVDGRRIHIFEDPVSELGHLLPEEIERIEFVGDRRATVLRVFTRDFMRRLIAQTPRP